MIFYDREREQKMTQKNKQEATDDMREGFVLAGSISILTVGVLSVKVDHGNC